MEFIEVNSRGCNDIMVFLLHTNHISRSLITEPTDTALTLILVSYIDVLPI
jgi:hypothetical protein